MSSHFCSTFCCGICCCQFGISYKLTLDKAEIFCRDCRRIYWKSQPIIKATKIKSQIVLFKFSNKSTYNYMMDGLMWNIQGLRNLFWPNSTIWENQHKVHRYVRGWMHKRALSLDLHLQWKFNFFDIFSSKKIPLKRICQWTPMNLSLQAVEDQFCKTAFVQIDLNYMNIYYMNIRVPLFSFRALENRFGRIWLFEKTITKCSDIYGFAYRSGTPWFTSIFNEKLIFFKAHFKFKKIYLWSLFLSKRLGTFFFRQLRMNFAANFIRDYVKRKLCDGRVHMKYSEP